MTVHPHLEPSPGPMHHVVVASSSLAVSGFGSWAWPWGWPDGTRSGIVFEGHAKRALTVKPRNSDVTVLCSPNAFPAPSPQAGPGRACVTLERSALFGGHQRGARLAQIIGGCQSRVSWLPKARVATDERRLGQSDHVFLVAGAGWGGTEGQCCGWGPERGSS